MKNKKIGFALTGSFCTFDEALDVIRELCALGYDIYPIMSEMSYNTDTKFGKAADFAQKLEMITDNTIIHTIVQSEPIGPSRMFDLLVVAPCTGNTLAKLNYGINDTSVTMAVKSHMRNKGSVLLAVSTNDALSNSAKNIGSLLNYKNVYFVPMKQDNPEEKPTSVVADFTQIPKAVEFALKGKQMQPIYF